MTKFKDYYLYTMNLQQSGKLTCAINLEEAGGLAYLQVYDRSEKIWQYQLSSSKKGMNYISVDLLAGDYTFVVYGGDRSFGYMTASMVLYFTPSGETVTENYMNKNNQINSATPYEIGQNIKAQFAINDIGDIYKVNIKKAGYLTVTFNNDISAMHMSIRHRDEDILYSETMIPIGRSSYKFLVTKGTYYINFAGNLYSGTYSFNTEISSLTKTKIKSAKNLKGKKAKISWAKRGDVHGYQVQIAQNKTFKKGKKSKTLEYYNYDNCTFTKLKKGKTYYARVRTYRILCGQKIYSDWSNVKKFKVKK